MPTIHTYFRISEAKKHLAELYKQKKQSAIFLVPTTLDKDTLTDLIQDSASVFGKRPNIMTLSELLKKLAENAEQPLHVIDPPDHKLILKYLIEKYKTDNEGMEFPAGMSHQGFVTLLSDNIHTLIKEGVKPSLIKERLADTLEGNNPEKLLCDLYKNYLDYLSEHNLVDSVQTPDKILEYLKNDPSFLKEKTLVIVGFSTFTGNQLMLFEPLCNIENCSCEFIMPQADMPDKSFRGGLQQLASFENIQNSNSLTDKIKPLKIKKLEGNNKNLEYMAVARELALWKLNKGNLTEAFGVLSDFGQVGILSTPQSLDSMENELRRYGIPYNVVSRGTVHDTPLGRLPQQIWAAYTSVWDTDETAALLSHPLLLHDGFSHRKYVKYFPHGEEGWRKALEGNKAALSLFDRLTALCSSFKEGGTPSQILTAWKNFLDTLNITHTASKLVQDDAEFDYTVKNLSTALHELDKKIRQLKGAGKNAGPAAELTFTGKDAVAFLLDWASTATLPIQLAQKNSLTLYGKAPATFEQHDFWIMTDIDASTWPGVLRESPLLRKEQLELINQKEKNTEAVILKSAHIPTIAEQREQKELLLRRLLATAKQGAVIARSTTDANGRPQGESIFVTRLFDKKTAQQQLFEPCGENIEYSLAKSLPQEGDEWFEGAELPENVKKQRNRGKLPRTAEYRQEKPTVSLSMLDSWTECPYFYWCRKMRLERWENNAYDPLKAGIFNHALWESYWKQPEENRGSFTAYVAANWNNEKLREDNYKGLSTDRLARYDALLKEEAFAVAELQDEIEKRAKAHGRLSVETEVQIKDANENDFEIDGVKFRGKFDRIDIYPGNKAVILDYKLDKAEKHADDLQLPAYAYLLKKLRGLDVAGFCWLGHGDGKLYGYFSDDKMASVYGIEEKSVCNNAVASDAQIAKAEETLTKIAAAVNDGTFKANYNARRRNMEKGSSACQQCEYQTLCRRREDPFYTEESEEGTEE